MRMPRYPVFIPSKGRADRLMTARMFAGAGVPFKVVVEPNEVSAYEKEWGDHLLVLPENNRGLVYSRNWIKRYSTDQGHDRHWQFDDDIRKMMRLHRGLKVPCDSRTALIVAEDFCDRYENVAIASFNTDAFVPLTGMRARSWDPFFLNSRCYTVFLVSNKIPNYWRGRYNEDTDMSLQVLADGMCTILFNAFLICTPMTMTAPGGQMVSAAGSYQGDGRLKMARDLERCWPGVVTTKRKFRRAQHDVKDAWRKFDTPLKRRADVTFADAPDNYGLEMRVLKDPKSPNVQAAVAKENARR